MKNDHRTELIDHYLSGQMNEEELKDFEQKLEKDPELAVELELQQDAIHGVHHHFSHNLKRMLAESDLKAEEAKVTSTPTRKLTGWLLLAASVSILLVMGFWLFSINQSPGELYLSYYQPYPNVINPLERSGPMPDKKSDRAMVAYEQAEYEMAVRLFEEENAPLSPGKKFYLALSYLETDQALTAADLLAEVVRSESEEFHLPARWYRGLALLANQDTAAAEAVFQEIAKEESAYQEKAREILSEL